MAIWAIVVIVFLGVLSFYLSVTDMVDGGAAIIVFSAMLIAGALGVASTYTTQKKIRYETILQEINDGETVLKEVTMINGTDTTKLYIFEFPGACCE